MKVLALETSDRLGSLAALEAQGGGVSVCHCEVLPAEFRSAQSLVPAIQGLLNDCQWTADQLDLVAVVSGPGSFTGLRIGVTTAKTIAYAASAQLVEVHTLAAIAAAVDTPTERLWTVLDAQRGELFVANFAKGWQSDNLNPPTTRVIAADAWLEELQPGDLVSGPPLSKLRDRLPADVQAVDEQLWYPQAEVVGRLGLATYQAGQTVAPMQLSPRYYRKSAAEEKADRQV